MNWYDYIPCIVGETAAVCRIFFQRKWQISLSCQIGGYVLALENSIQVPLFLENLFTMFLQKLNLFSIYICIKKLTINAIISLFLGLFLVPTKPRAYLMK